MAADVSKLQLPEILLKQAQMAHEAALADQSLRECP